MKCECIFVIGHHNFNIKRTEIAHTLVINRGGLLWDIWICFNDNFYSCLGLTFRSTTDFGDMHCMQ